MRASRLPFEYEVGGGAGDLVEGLPTDGTRGVHAQVGGQTGLKIYEI